MADAQEAQGFEIRIENIGSPQSFQSIPGVEGTPSLSVNNTLVPITDFDSTHTEDLDANVQSSSLSFTLNWLPSNAVHEELELALADGERRNYQVAFPDNASEKVYAFSAIVESIAAAPTVAGVLKRTVSLKNQSRPTEV